jgi:RNA polymerase sigma-70 factor (ECF subfamily)
MESVSAEGFYERFKLYVRARLAASGVRGADIDDACHDVFLVVLRHCDALKRVEQPRCWLGTISWRVAANYRRRVRRRRELGGLDEHAVDEMLHHDARVAAERHDEPCTHDLGLDRLDDDEIHLLALRFVSELSITEIAKRMGRDRKTVRKRLDLAMKRLGRTPVAQSRDDFLPNARTCRH